MNSIAPPSPVVALRQWMQQRAGLLDDAAAFPAEEITALRACGALRSPLPAEGGDGDVDLLADMLMQLGAANLSVGRLVEAHINARHLIARYGTPQQRALANADVRDGHLFALWVTDPPDGGLRMMREHGGIRLDGGKMFCSGAGHATRALVTAIDAAGGAQMLIASLHNGERTQMLESPLQGMRAAVTGAVDFTGCMIEADACLGQPGDYLREPDFSTGAWRSSAVAAGGLQSLLDEATTQLRAVGRLANPHQLQRLGSAMIAAETSRLWVLQAARTAEDGQTAPARAVSYVGLARIAVEAACLDAMRLVQRSLGLSAFRRGNAAERICRDLGTYLRQPAPDEVLTEAAAFLASHPLAGA